MRMIVVILSNKRLQYTERIDDLIETYKINEIKNPDMKRLFNIDKNLKNIWTEMQARAEDENREIKWKYAAIVMDRLFFFQEY